MRRAAKVDNTQAEIVKALRSAGMQVCVTSALGNGFPDLVIGWRGANYLLELKTVAYPCDRKLTAAEQEWHDSWAGQVDIVSTPDEAYKAVVEAAIKSGRI